MGLLAFTARLFLYCGTCALTLVVKGLETDTARSLIMSDLQVLMVASGILLYMFASVLFSAVREAYAYKATELNTEDINSVTSEISFSNIDRIDAVAPADMGVSCEDEVRQTHTLPTAIAAVRHSPPLHRKQAQSCGDLDVEAMRKNIDVLSRAESPFAEESVNFTLDRETVQRSSPRIFPVEVWTFQNSRELQIYIVHVHIIGAVLWITVTSLDFSHPIFLTFFTTGLFVGVMVSHGNRLDSLKNPSKRSVGSTCAYFVYCILFTIIVATCFLHEQLAIESVIDMLFYCAVTVAGIVLGVQPASRRLVSTAHNAFISTTIMSLPMLFLLTTLDDIEKLIHVRGLLALYLLVIEPALKFVNIYVLILSIQANRTIEISIILVSVLCVQICYLVYDAENEHELTIMAVVIIAALLLLILHIARICLGG